MEDRLTQLPDEVVVSILSQLTIREAVVTSCLSSQLRYLWVYVTRLNFDVSKFITEETSYHPRLCRKEGLRHMNFINYVLDFHKNDILQEFSLSFPYHRRFKRKIDKWLKFASSKKKVETLQIDLSLNRYEHKRYTFPYKLILNTTNSNLSPFFGLKVVALKNVHVDNRVVDFFISNSPLLEKLSIFQSLLLTHLEIVGPSCLKLKDLEISYCNNLDLIKIHDINLVSFKYRGWKPNLLLQNVTSIIRTDFYMIDGLVCELIPKLTTHFTQLVMLSLEFSLLKRDLRTINYSFPTFNNLKVLVFKIVDVIDVHLLGITPLIEASPYLQKLHIQLEWYETTITKCEIIRKKCPHQHQHLKEVKYSGYLGGLGDMILTTYLVENSVALETFIIDPFKYDDQGARGRARRQLQGIIPKRVKLVIL